MSILSLEAVTRRFGSFTAVDHLSLSIEKGEIFGLLGPNGAGKTTTIRMISGLIRPDSGFIRFNGNSGIHPSKIGVCPQNIVIWPNLTCREQLIFTGRLYGMTPKEAAGKADALLELMNLTEKKNILAKTLSGGMQRRLNLLLGLVHSPEILILDEPEAGLDPQSRVLVRDTIRELAKKLTVLYTTHNMDEAERLCTRTAVIDHGKLLALDTPDALKEQVGREDVLELELSADVPESLVREMGDEIAVLKDGPFLTLRARSMADRLSPVFITIQKSGFQIREAKLRQTTLEDVFLNLTGRRIRE